MNLSKDTVEKAQDLGLNVSKVAGNALKDMIRRIERFDCPKNKNLLVRDAGISGVTVESDDLLNPRSQLGRLKSSPD